MNWKAAAVVVLAPLVGALVYALQTAILWMNFEAPSTALSTALVLVPIGWAYGLVLTVIVGLPLGLLVAWALRRARVESVGSYCVAGALTAFLFAMVLPSRDEMWAGITVTGFLMGLGYWKTVRARSLKAADA